MQPVHHDQIGLVDLLEFNRQIEGMLAAGIPLSWQGDDSGAVLRSESERIGGRVAILIGEGRTFLEAWNSIPGLSLVYKAAFVSWALSSRSPVAFDLLKPNTLRLPHARKLWFLNFQLGLVFVLALGVFGVWLSFGRMSLIYDNSKLEVGPLSRLLEWLQTQPTYAMAGGLFALFVWGCLLYLAKARSIKLSQAITSKESQANDSWIKSQFMRVVAKHTESLEEAERLFASLVYSRNVKRFASDAVEEKQAEQVNAPEMETSNKPWPSPQSYILWSAEKAVERRLSYRVSTLPYTIYFVGSGVVVLCIGVLVFGPLIELLYATVVPGAF